MGVRLAVTFEMAGMNDPCREPTLPSSKRGPSQPCHSAPNSLILRAKSDTPGPTKLSLGPAIPGPERSDQGITLRALAYVRKDARGRSPCQAVVLRCSARNRMPVPAQYGPVTRSDPAGEYLPASQGGRLAASKQALCGPWLVVNSSSCAAVRGGGHC